MKIAVIGSAYVGLGRRCMFCVPLFSHCKTMRLIFKSMIRRRTRL